MIGCPDVKGPIGGWVKNNEDSAIFGCNSGAETWEIICDGGRWVGEFRNCSVGKYTLYVTCMLFYGLYWCWVVYIQPIIVVLYPVPSIVFKTSSKTSDFNWLLRNVLCYPGTEPPCLNHLLYDDIHFREFWSVSANPYSFQEPCMYHNIRRFYISCFQFSWILDL